MVLVLWFVASGVLLYTARGRTVDGINRLEDAGEQLTGPGILRGEGQDALAAAFEDFEAAKGSASSPMAPFVIDPDAPGGVTLLPEPVRATFSTA